MDTDSSEQFEAAVRADGRFPLEAFAFLQRGLQHTAEKLHDPKEPEGSRHISGQQFCEGLRELASELWGPLAGEVLQRWNIRSTRDFGEMVFFMIELGLMGKQEHDRIEDFNQVYDFQTAFGRYEIELDDDDE